MLKKVMKIINLHSENNFKTLSNRGLTNYSKKIVTIYKNKM